MLSGEARRAGRMLKCHHPYKQRCARHRGRATLVGPMYSAKGADFRGEIRATRRADEESRSRRRDVHRIGKARLVGPICAAAILTESVRAVEI